MSLRTLRPALIALLSALLLASPSARAADPPTAADLAVMPSARTSDLTFSLEADAVLLKDTPSGQIYRLHPIASAVYVLSDGKTSITDIRKGAVALTGYDIDDATVFGALDALADAKLLVARVTPPGGSDLDLIVLTDGDLGTALVTAPAGLKEAAPIESSKLKPREQEAKKARRPQYLKEAEKKRLNSQVQQAATEKTAAVVEYKAARDRNLEASNKKIGQEEKTKRDQQASDARTKAQGAAKKESALRKEEAKKAQEQTQKDK